VNNNIVADRIEILTNQRIIFSAYQTADNVPLEYLNFTWNWGDGSAESSGQGMYTANHEWGDVVGPNQTYTLTLSVSDGINVGQKTIEVIVNNRQPYQIFSDILNTYTYTPLLMPDVFTDDDGENLSLTWTFVDGVNLDGVEVDRTDDFSSTSSVAFYPAPAWNTPGTKNITVTVTDEDGAVSIAELRVNVINQLPVANYIVKESGATGAPQINFLVDDAQVNVPYTFDGRTSFDIDGTTGTYNDLTFNWSFPDGTFSNKTLPAYSFTEPGEQIIQLVVTDESGEQSSPKVIVVVVANPLPIIQLQILDAWVDDELLMDSDVFPENGLPDQWSRTFDENGVNVAIPGALLYFDSSGTRDGDQKFEGKYVPLEVESPDWNGLLEYTWDFGDATPIVHEPMPWHSYERPGLYTVKLTVRDAFGTGDVTRAEFNVHVDSPPEIADIDLPDEIFEDFSSAVIVNVSDAESLADLVFYRDLNVLDGSNSDRDETISNDLVVEWEQDILDDADEDGILDNDWFVSSNSIVTLATVVWEDPTDAILRVKVCDGMGLCDVAQTDVTVLPEQVADPSLSDFSWDEWKSWMSDAGSDALGFIALILAALILGWLVMRQPNDIEEEAKQNAETYDVEHADDGGLLGMDHHNPPPAPKILSKQERRNDESGYIRPLRRRE
jgi:PKD repeat protein